MCKRRARAACAVVWALVSVLALCSFQVCAHCPSLPMPVTFAPQNGTLNGVGEGISQFTIQFPVPISLGLPGKQVQLYRDGAVVFAATTPSNSIQVLNDTLLVDTGLALNHSVQYRVAMQNGTVMRGADAMLVGGNHTGCVYPGLVGPLTAGWLGAQVYVFQLQPGPTFTHCPSSRTVALVLNSSSAIHVSENMTALAVTTSGPISYTYNITNLAGYSNVTNAVGSDLSGMYQIGTNHVNLRATDSAGNSSLCSFTITVQDPFPPYIEGLCAAAQDSSPLSVVSSGVTSPGSVNGTVRLTGVVYDNDDLSAVTISYSSNASALSPSPLHVPFAANPAATTIVNLTGVYPHINSTELWVNATDRWGNTASCRVTMQVDDLQPPVISCPPGYPSTAATFPTSINVSSGVVGQFRANVTDNINPHLAPFGFLNNNGSGAADPLSLDAAGVYALGFHDIRFFAGDSAGNFALCTRVLGIVDTQPPFLSASTGVVVTLGTLGSTGRSLTDSDLAFLAWDNSMDSAQYKLRTNITRRWLPLPSHPSYLGPNTWVVTRTYGFVPGGGGTGYLSTAPATVSVSQSLAVGNYTFSVQVRDDSNLTSAFVVREVRIVDADPPTVTCTALVQAVVEPGKLYRNLTLSASASDNLAYSELTESNNITANASLSVFQYGFSLGTTVVQWAAVDESGNMGTCTTTVNISNTDLCVALDPCKNGSTCITGLSSYTCVCAAGFTGINCSVNIDDCANVTCLNGGVCIDGVNSSSCACSAGFTGANCSVNIDDCAASPCVANATCVDGVATYACVCPLGFSGPACASSADDCTPTSCTNGGTCVDGFLTFSCVCPVGYQGSTCQMPQIRDQPFGTPVSTELSLAALWSSPNALQQVFPWQTPSDQWFFLYGHRMGEVLHVVIEGTNITEYHPAPTKTQTMGRRQYSSDSAIGTRLLTLGWDDAGGPDFIPPPPEHSFGPLHHRSAAVLVVQCPAGALATAGYKSLEIRVGPYLPQISYRTDLIFVSSLPAECLQAGWYSPYGGLQVHNVSIDRLLVGGPYQNLLCFPCPRGGLCPGGGRVWPKPGFWAPDEYTAPSPCLFGLACRGIADYSSGGGSGVSSGLTVSSAMVDTQSSKLTEAQFSARSRFSSTSTPIDTLSVHEDTTIGYTLNGGVLYNQSGFTIADGSGARDTRRCGMGYSGKYCAQCVPDTHFSEAGRCIPCGFLTDRSSLDGVADTGFSTTAWVFMALTAVFVFLLVFLIVLVAAAIPPSSLALWLPQLVMFQQFLLCMWVFVRDLPESTSNYDDITGTAWHSNAPSADYAYAGYAYFIRMLSALFLNWEGVWKPGCVLPNLLPGEGASHYYYAYVGVQLGSAVFLILAIGLGVYIKVRCQRAMYNRAPVVNLVHTDTGQINVQVVPFPLKQRCCLRFCMGLDVLCCLFFIPAALCCFSMLQCRDVVETSEATTPDPLSNPLLSALSGMTGSVSVSSFVAQYPYRSESRSVLVSDASVYCDTSMHMFVQSLAIIGLLWLFLVYPALKIHGLYSQFGPLLGHMSTQEFDAEGRLIDKPLFRDGSDEAFCPRTSRCGRCCAFTWATVTCRCCLACCPMETDAEGRGNSGHRASDLLIPRVGNISQRMELWGHFYSWLGFLRKVAKDVQASERCRQKLLSFTNERRDELSAALHSNRRFFQKRIRKKQQKVTKAASSDVKELTIDSGEQDSPSAISAAGSPSGTDRTTSKTKKKKKKKISSIRDTMRKKKKVSRFAGLAKKKKRSKSKRSRAPPPAPPEPPSSLSNLIISDRSVMTCGNQGLVDGAGFHNDNGDLSDQGILSHSQCSMCGELYCICDDALPDGVHCEPPPPPPPLRRTGTAALRSFMGNVGKPRFRGRGRGRRRERGEVRGRGRGTGRGRGRSRGRGRRRGKGRDNGRRRLRSQGGDESGSDGRPRLASSDSVRVDSGDGRTFSDSDETQANLMDQSLPSESKALESIVVESTDQKTPDSTPKAVKDESTEEEESEESDGKTEYPWHDENEKFLKARRKIENEMIAEEHLKIHEEYVRLVKSTQPLRCTACCHRFGGLLYFRVVVFYFSLIMAGVAVFCSGSSSPADHTLDAVGGAGSLLTLGTFWFGGLGFFLMIICPYENWTWMTIEVGVCTVYYLACLACLASLQWGTFGPGSASGFLNPLSQYALSYDAVLTPRYDFLASDDYALQRSSSVSTWLVLCMAMLPLYALCIFSYCCYKRKDSRHRYDADGMYIGSPFHPDIFHKRPKRKRRSIKKRNSSLSKKVSREDEGARPPTHDHHSCCVWVYLRCRKCLPLWCYKSPYEEPSASLTELMREICRDCILYGQTTGAQLRINAHDTSHVSSAPIPSQPSDILQDAFLRREVAYRLPYPPRVAFEALRAGSFCSKPMCCIHSCAQCVVRCVFCQWGNSNAVGSHGRSTSRSISLSRIHPMTNADTEPSNDIRRLCGLDRLSYMVLEAELKGEKARALKVWESGFVRPSGISVSVDSQAPPDLQLSGDEKARNFAESPLSATGRTADEVDSRSQSPLYGSAKVMPILEESISGGVDVTKSIAESMLPEHRSLEQEVKQMLTGPKISSQIPKDSSVHLSPKQQLELLHQLERNVSTEVGLRNHIRELAQAKLVAQEEAKQAFLQRDTAMDEVRAERERIQSLELDKHRAEQAAKAAKEDASSLQSQLEQHESKMIEREAEHQAHLETSSPLFAISPSNGAAGRSGQNRMQLKPMVGPGKDYAVSQLSDSPDVSPSFQLLTPADAQHFTGSDVQAQQAAYIAASAVLNAFSQRKNVFTGEANGTQRGDGEAQPPATAPTPVTTAHTLNQANNSYPYAANGALETSALLHNSPSDEYEDEAFFDYSDLDPADDGYEDSHHHSVGDLPHTPQPAPFNPAQF